MTGCYFHLAQSIIRKVNELGMKTEYENESNFRCSLRCLAALALVPVDDLQEAFDLLVESMPAHDRID